MKLRHSYHINHRVAYVLFALSLQHYSNIMRRILLVYTLYMGAYFLLFGRRMHPRVYRLFRARGPFLAVGRHGAGGAFVWGSWQLAWRWLYLAGARSGAAAPDLRSLRSTLLDRALMLVACGYMQDSDIKKYRVGPLRGHVVALSGGALSHLWVRGRRL